MSFRRTSAALLAVLGIAVTALTTSDSANAARRHRVVSGPVCGMRADGPHTYSDAAMARRDRARVMHPGECQPIICWGAGMILIQRPMCGIDPLNHARMTYPNECAAERAGATWVHNGPCGGGRRR